MCLHTVLPSAHAGLKQPLFYIERWRVLESLRRNAARFDGLTFGKNSLDQMVTKIEGLPVRRMPDLLDVSQVCQTLLTGWTGKMLGECQSGLEACEG